MTAGESWGLSAELARQEDHKEDERSRVEVDKVSLFVRESILLRMTIQRP
jgi:hypothetical protein